MLIQDRLYGEIAINERVLVELIETPAMQRLKEVDQAGYFEPFFPGTKHNRFEHSLGVCHLLAKFDASLEEQIAGLLHDVSHTAFSHCADYALAGGSESEHSFQDNIHDTYIKSTNIPEILTSFGFDLEYILDDAHFPLKERSLPDICADRLDYCLRGAVAAQVISKKSALLLLDKLTVKNSQWIFCDSLAAGEFAELFSRMNKIYWSGLPSALMFRAVGDYLKHAMAMDYIKEKDVFLNDEELLAKIAPWHQKDKILAKYFTRMNNRATVTLDERDYDAKVVVKSRAVDPLCWHEGEIKRFSDVESRWKNIVNDESAPKIYYLKYQN